MKINNIKKIQNIIKKYNNSILCNQKTKTGAR